MYVYKITNSINGKCYIGIDSRPSSEMKRWREHCRQYKNTTTPAFEKKHLYRAMRKYNVSNFTFKIIDHAFSLDELKEKEIKWIEIYNSFKAGYNMTLGGDYNWWYTATDDQKQSANARKREFMVNFYTDADKSKRSQIVKKEWDTFTPDQKEEKLKGLRKYFDNLNSEDWHHIAKRGSEAALEINIKTYLVISPTGEKITVTNLNDFARTNGLIRSGLDQVAKGKITNHRGWKCYKTDKDGKPIIPSNAPSRTRCESWIVIDPNGNEIPIENLTMFCTLNNLSLQTMLRVADGKTKNWHGWRCYRIMPDGTANIPEYQAVHTWKATAPAGDIYEFDNLSAFCKEHSLSVACMSYVAHGRNKHHKGWKCEKLEHASI